MTSVSILHIDECPLFHHILSLFLRGRLPHCFLVGQARSSKEALALAPVLRPDLILCDFSMPGFSSAKMIPQLRAMLPQTPIIALTLFRSRQPARQAGSDASVLKSKLGRDLLREIQRVCPEAHSP